MPLPRPARALIPAIALLAAAPLLMVPTTAAPAAADEAENAGPGSGALLLTGPGIARALPAVRLGTDIAADVTGPVARVRVTQAFRNTSAQWMEATYLYPLPQDGAVDGLRMVVGRRVIVGHIEKRAEARATYEAAKAKGQKAGLVEQQRPNMFTTSVANVGPGETVLVQIDYQMPVRQTGGVFALRLPLVVGPRYTPPHTIGSVEGAADARAVTSSPVLDPKLGTVNPTTIAIHLRPGFAPAEVVSRYHAIVQAGNGGDRTIRLAARDVPADRDFELDWRPAGPSPEIGLFREHVGAADYVMASILPPAPPANAPTPPREMVFVIDNSGSMGGQSMDEAKASLVHALGVLRPQDSFNVIRFDDTMTMLFPHSVAGSAGNVATAIAFAQKLQAAGGTEMLPALKAALADAAASGGADVVRQIVFLTDGEVSNEKEMLAALAADGGRSHLFPVGIGSAPNDFLMARMAAMGRGTYTHVGTPEEVAARMLPLLDMLRRPAATDIAVKVEGAALDLTPNLLPDLYAGEPLVLVGKADRVAGTLTVSGTTAGARWTRTVDLARAESSPAVAKLWARRRIEDVEADRAIGRVDDAAADAEVERIGLENGLVTDRTSLVAVDKTPSRAADVPLTREDLPLDLPAGWDFATLFGREAAAGALPAAPAETAAALDLPQTATGFVGMLGEGLALLVVGASGLVGLRRRRAL